ncbi:MAG TPA: chalcone isomerase family protein [Steroidobacteraceae bacterium]|nr:chalcone isomerase family protein [Steroidobacteraceae bacterium]
MLGKALLAGSALLLAAGAATAAQCLTAEFPEHVQLGGATLTLNGLGVRKATFLRVNVYVAALYLIRPTQDGRAIIDSRGPFELDLQFVRSVGAKAIRNGFAEGFAQVPHSPAIDSRIATLNGWMEDIHSGERMSFVRVPGRGVQFSFAGKPRGVIPGEDFARALLAIWLGDHPPNAELKAGLLGAPCH